MPKKIPFMKMVGAGNDFIVIDATRLNVNAKNLAQRVCDRTDGLGADGLVLLGSSRKADYKMRIMNSDGSEAEMCGNGARCLAAYIVNQKKPKKPVFTIETLAGILEGEAKGQVARVRLSDPGDYHPDKKIKLDGKPLIVHYIDTGVPHVIVYVRDLAKTDVRELGETLRYHTAFKPRGANINFVEFLNDSLVENRTYERGVEDETKACGTGSVAAALVSYRQVHSDIKNKKKARMNVKTKSGEILQVTFDMHDGVFSNVYLKGSARFVARGEYYL